MPLIPFSTSVHDSRCHLALQGGALAGVAAAYFGLGLQGEQLGGLLVAIVFVYFADQVATVTVHVWASFVEWTAIFGDLLLRAASSATPNPNPAGSTSPLRADRKWRRRAVARTGQPRARHLPLVHRARRAARGGALPGALRLARCLKWCPRGARECGAILALTVLL